MKKFFHILLLLCFVFSAKAQKTNVFFSSNSNDEEVLKLLQEKETKNKKDAYSFTQSKIFQLYSLGYLTSSIDSTHEDSTSITCYITPGKKYYWAELRNGNIESEIIRKTTYKPRYYFNSPIQPKRTETILRSILRTYENNGFPFASIKLDSLQFDSNKVSASIVAEKNKLIKIDSVIIKGNAKINPTYLYNYLNIQPGDLYSEKLFREIPVKLSEIPFLKTNSQPEVLFFEDMTKLYLSLSKKKASKFNGVIGFLPNQYTGKVLITGDIELLLNNELGRGEKIGLNWRKLQNNATDLRTVLNYPFILNTPFGIEGTFYLYKRDTIYQDIYSKINMQYILPGANHIGLYYENKTSRLLNSASYKNATRLPNVLDINKHIYGVAIKKTKLDYRFNPRKGYDLDLTGGIGSRKIIQNPDVPSELYDTLAISSTQYNATLLFDYFIPIGKNATINLGFNGSRLQASSIFMNEQYRIGGFKTLRGFDEESIFASSYAIGTIEYRYLLEKNSFARAFFDGAYYENKTTYSFKNDFPFGFGVGFSFETKAGIFSLDYALGYQQKQLAPIRSAKIHFGFVNYF